MKIVIADSYAALPGDLDWSGIEEMGECVFYEYTRPEDLALRAADAEILLTRDLCTAIGVYFVC